MPYKHTNPPEDVNFPTTLHADRHKIEEVQVPIVTVSATFKTDIEKVTHEPTKQKKEVVLSRAHYSMAVAILDQAKEENLSSWLVDPLNYLTPKQWEKIQFVETVGKIMARNTLLKKIKDFIDTFARGKLPISQAITEPLLYVTQKAKRPIISLHYEAGNILSKNGKQVLQVITDPHIRPQYLDQAERKNITFAVFDEKTKQDFFDKAKELGKKVNEKQVVVTGPPVDPRIVRARKNKKGNNYKKRGLRLVFTTSGLGTNKNEIEKILDQLFPFIKDTQIQVLLYASTHQDFKDMFYGLGNKHKIKIGNKESQAQVRLIFHSSIIQANQELIEYGFPWADGFITKPSGDMAYDAVGAGCFLLTLNPWGEWEENIERIFSNLGISQKADVDNFSQQLDSLLKDNWFEQAQEKALNIDKLYLNGSKKLVDLQQTLPYNE